ncbi:hypothetical protein EPN42_13060 [bacterium]|nr:MAG: hypothetical protein EPN42_13060 [bacterium]
MTIVGGQGGPRFRAHVVPRLEPSMAVGACAIKAIDALGARERRLATVIPADRGLMFAARFPRRLSLGECRDAARHRIPQSAFPGVRPEDLVLALDVARGNEEHRGRVGATTREQYQGMVTIADVCQRELVGVYHAVDAWRAALPDAQAIIHLGRKSVMLVIAGAEVTSTTWQRTRMRDWKDQVKEQIKEIRSTRPAEAREIALVGLKPEDEDVEALVRDVNVNVYRPQAVGIPTALTDQAVWWLACGAALCAASEAP